MRAPRLKMWSGTVGNDFDVGDAADEVDTIGGYLVTRAGRLPLRGEIVPARDLFEFEVLDADPRRVKRVRITRLKERRDRPREPRRQAKPTHASASAIHSSAPTTRPHRRIPSPQQVRRDRDDYPPRPHRDARRRLAACDHCIRCRRRVGACDRAYQCLAGPVRDVSDTGLACRRLGGRAPAAAR